jgi:putative FmdB family regulatory protein
MPNYEYECRLCSHQWDDIQTIANREKPCAEPCPRCRERGVQRGWSHSPTMGADGGLKPNRAFTERMNLMREKLGRYNPTVRNNIDRALDHRGGRYGPQ